MKSISMIYLPEEPPRAINGVVDVELLTIRYLLRNGSARRGGDSQFDLRVCA